MICKDDITGALDDAGVPWAEPTFAPAKPPQPPYAILLDTLRVDGADESVGMVGHDTRILLYDMGDPAGKAKRAVLMRLLAEAGAHHSVYPSDYDYELKLFETEFDITDTYYEKWSDTYDQL